jgi:hypothetical protein
MAMDYQENPKVADSDLAILSSWNLQFHRYTRLDNRAYMLHLGLQS